MKIAALAPVVAALALLPGFAAAQQDGAPAAATPCDPGPAFQPLSPDAKAAVAGINAFSLDLYKRTLKPGENQFLSPASVSTAVALAYRGAVGQTAEELRRVLHYTAEPAAYFRASAAVFATMNFCGPGRPLQTANSIWVQEGVPLKPDYAADMQKFMAAGVRRTDFKADPDQSVVGYQRLGRGGYARADQGPGSPGRSDQQDASDAGQCDLLEGPLAGNVRRRQHPYGALHGFGRPSAADATHASAL
jgi:serpin B